MGDETNPGIHKTQIIKHGMPIVGPALGIIEKQTAPEAFLARKQNQEMENPDNASRSQNIS